METYTYKVIIARDNTAASYPPSTVVVQAMNLEDAINQAKAKRPDLPFLLAVWVSDPSYPLGFRFNQILCYNGSSKYSTTKDDDDDDGAGGKGPGGWPSTTGNPSGGGRDNNPPG